MKAHLRYLWYVLKHKWYVFLACLSYGLVWQGITHDWSKFLPDEWGPYVSHFYGPKPPRGQASGYFHKPGANTAFDVAWNHHQKRQPHHWQYHLLFRDDGTVEALPMPDRYRKEMLADWRGAGRAQGTPDTRGWYLANRDKMRLHPNTRAWVEEQLQIGEIGL